MTRKRAIGYGRVYHEQGSATALRKPLMNPLQAAFNHGNEKTAKTNKRNRNPIYIHLTGIDETRVMYRCANGVLTVKAGKMSD